MFSGQFFPFQPIQFADGLLTPPPGFTTGGGGGPTTLTFITSETVGDATFGTIDIPVTAQSGDLAVLFDAAWNGAGGVPTAVTPSTWTLCTPSTSNDTASNDTRVVASYKILGPSDPGATITCMNSANESRIMMIFRPDAPITTVTPGSWNSQNTANDPASQSVLASGQATPLVVLGFTYEQAGITAFGTASPAFDAVILETDLDDSAAGYKIYNSSPANHTIDQIDEGNANILVSGYLRVS